MSSGKDPASAPGKPSSAKPGQVNYLSRVNPAFETLYLEARKKEGRLYTAEQVRRLPFAEKHDPQAREWQARRQSAEHFVNYVRKKNIKHALEVGCGNGWFSNYLAKYTAISSVSGLDINEFELKLAAEVFNSARLLWIYADVFSAEMPADHYDLIVLNSSVQYFPDLNKLIARLKELLVTDGEIHIMDSHFYGNMEEKEKARQRTTAYYEKLGYPALAGNYHHHLWSDIEKSAPVVLWKPSAADKFFGKLTGKAVNPFPWICIRKN